MDLHSIIHYHLHPRWSLSEKKRKKETASSHSHLSFNDASWHGHAHTRCSSGRSANSHHGVWQVDGHCSGRSHHRAWWWLWRQRRRHVQHSWACGLAGGVFCCDGETSRIFVKDFWDGQPVGVGIHADLVILGDQWLSIEQPGDLRSERAISAVTLVWQVVCFLVFTKLKFCWD